MLWVKIGKVSLIGARISPNIVCSIKYSGVIQHSQTHYDTTSADIDESFSFRDDGTQWLRIEIRNREYGEEEDTVMMCAVDEDVSKVGEEQINKVAKLEGRKEFCNSGRVEYLVRRAEKTTNVFDVVEPQRQQVKHKEVQHVQSQAESIEIPQELFYRDHKQTPIVQQQSNDANKQLKEPPIIQQTVALSKPNRSFESSNNFSLEEKIRINRVPKEQNSRIISTDEEGMKFAGHIGKMLGDQFSSRKNSSHGRKTFGNTSMSEENFVFNPKKINVIFGQKKRTGGFQESEQTNLVFNQPQEQKYKAPNINLPSNDSKEVRLQKLKQIGQVVLDSKIHEIEQDFKKQQHISYKQVNKTEDQLQGLGDFEQSNNYDNKEIHITPRNFGKARKSNYIHQRKKNLKRKIQYTEPDYTQGDQLEQNMKSQGVGVSQNKTQQNKIKSYLESTYFNSANVRVNHQKIKHYDQKIEEIFSISCVKFVKYRQIIGLQNLIYLEIFKDGLKIKDTKPSQNQNSPYAWPDTFQIGSFDQLKFNLIKKQLGLQQNKVGQSLRKTGSITVGTANYKNNLKQDVQRIVLPINFNGFDIGEINFKIARKKIAQLRQQESYPKQRKKLSNQQKQINSNKQQSKYLFGLRQRDNEIVKLTAKNQRSIVNGLQNLAHHSYKTATGSSQIPSSISPSKSSQIKLQPLKKVVQPPSSPVKIFYPRSRAGFLTGMSGVDISRARLEESHPDFSNKSTRHASENEVKHANPQQSSETLHFNTIIFKNYDYNNTGALCLVIQYQQKEVTTQCVYGKDILWTKHVISGNFHKLDAIVKFTIYEKVGDERVLFARNSIFISDIRSKTKMYSFKLSMFSAVNIAIGELLFHYQFKKDGQLQQKRQRFLSFSLDNKKRQRCEQILREQQFHARHYSKKVLQPINYSSSHRLKKRVREPHYYTGSNIKFGQAPRFKHIDQQENTRKIPGPGAYEVPSVFDRHSVQQ